MKSHLDRNNRKMYIRVSIAIFVFLVLFLNLYQFYRTPNPQQIPNSKITYDISKFSEEWKKMWEEYDQVKRYFIPDYKFIKKGEDQPRVHNGPIQWNLLPNDVKLAFTLGNRLDVQTDVIHEMPSFQWDYQKIGEWIKKINESCPSSYGQTGCNCFFNAFKEFPIQGKSVLIVGSLIPWVEVIALSYGAKSVTTTDFNVQKINGKKDIPLEFKSFDELRDELFDVVISYSSLEHDGLGRYGDPIHPYGDILRMKAMKKMLKPNGIFYLGIPLAVDSLLFNRHRIYGKLRIPFMIEDYKKIGFFSGNKDIDWEKSLNLQKFEWTNQPLILLQNV